MENNDLDPRTGEWVEERMASLEPSKNWKPDAAQGLDRFHQMQKARRRRFLATGGVADYAGDDARHAGVVRAEGGFEVERAPGCFHDVNGVAACVHDTLTPAGANL